MRTRACFIRQSIVCVEIFTRWVDLTLPRNVVMAHRTVLRSRGGHATLRNLVYVREQTWSRLCNVLIWPTNLDSDGRPNPITLSISSTISVASSMSSSILTSSSHYIIYSRCSSRRAGSQITCKIGGFQLLMPFLVYSRRYNEGHVGDIYSIFPEILQSSAESIPVFSGPSAASRFKTSPLYVRICRY